MTDIVDKATRSRMMSGIRGKNTRPEIEIRRRIFSKGFRYRLHDKRLPGKPDMVFPRHNAVVFIHGCFWHAHSCPLFKLPSTNTDFWGEKLLGNRKKDRENESNLVQKGWRIMTIWECVFRGRGINREKAMDSISEEVSRWLVSKKDNQEIEL